MTEPSDDAPPPPGPPRPGRLPPGRLPPGRWPLSLAWLATGLVVGLLGLFLFSLAEQPGDRWLGVAHMAAAVLALGVGAGVLSGATRPWRWSRPLSGLLLLLGAGTVAVLLREEPVFLEDVLLLAVPPLLGGLLTAALARRRSVER